MAIGRKPIGDNASVQAATELLLRRFTALVEQVGTTTVVGGTINATVAQPTAPIPVTSFTRSLMLMGG